MNAPFMPSQQRAPDITLSGEAVEQLFALLNNGVIFVKTQDGALRPFIDPAPVQQILSAALQQAAQVDRSPAN